MAMPIPLVIFQLKRRMEKKTRRSIMKRRVTEQIMPSLRTGTASLLMREKRNQGRGSLPGLVSE